jgi:hypothetical protein
MNYIQYFDSEKYERIVFDLCLYFFQVNLIGILLSFDTSGQEKTYSVLILVDDSQKSSSSSASASSGSPDKKLNDYLSLATQGVSLPNCISANHQVRCLRDDY